MVSLLSYFKLEGVSHPATSDLEIGLNIDEKYATQISNLISTVFENEIVNFNCKNNGIESYVIVASDTKKLQFTMECDKYKYFIIDVDNNVLESISCVVKNHTTFKKNINENIKTRNWNKTV